MAHEADIQARLKRLVEEELYGEDILALLRHMVAFQGPFHRNTLTVIAPKDMSRQTRMNALTTLMQWGFLEKRLVDPGFARWRPYHGIFLKREVFKALDVNRDVYNTSLFHSIDYFLVGNFSHYKLVYNDTWLEILIKMLKINPMKGIKFFLSFNPFKFVDYAAQDAAYEIYQAFKDSNRFLPSLLYLASVVEAYDLAWKSAERVHILRKLNTSDNSLENFFTTSRYFIPSDDEEKVFVEQAYERAALNARWGPRMQVRLRLSVVKFEQKKMLEAEQYYDAAIGAFRPNQNQNREQLYLARVAEVLGKITVARSLYAQLYILASQVEALWYWGCMEYQQGQKEQGISLCRLALHEWNVTIEDYNEDNNYTNQNRTFLERHRWQQKYEELQAMEQARSGHESTP